MSDPSGRPLTGDPGPEDAAAPAADGRGEPAADGVSKGERAIRGTLAAGLILEGITVLFVPTTVAALDEDGLGGPRLGLLLGLAAALFVAGGLQKYPFGRVVGTVLQVPVIAAGVLVGAMYVLGLVFAAVWGYLLWIRLEILRAAAA